MSDTPGDDVARRPDPLVVSASAHSSHVRVLRRRLSRWLDEDHLDADVVDDLVMATSEALENCCDHAFTGASSLGTMTLTADALHDDVVITIADDGSWKAGGDPGHRGRGLAMMRALVDEVEVAVGPAGTRLSLIHHLDR